MIFSDLVTNEGLFCDGDWIEKKDQDPNGAVRLIQLADIGVCEFKDKSSRFITESKAKELHCTYLEKGDILIARLPDPLGRACIFPLDGKYITAVDVAIVRITRKDINPKFVMYMINSPIFRNEIKKYESGTTRKRISRKNLDKIEFAIPLLPEQNRIVAQIEELFSELDNGVETLQKTKQQLAVYRQAVLKQAFDVKLTGCTSMKEVPLKDLVSGKDGLRRGPFGSAIKKAFFVPDGFKVYEQGNAINNDPYRGHYYITQEKYEELKNFHIKPHDLLVSCSGVTLGRIVELPENAKPGVINQALLRIRLNHKVIATRYFIEYFRSEMFQRKIFDKSQGSAMPNLVGITEFREITLNVPVSIDDQLAIVRELENRLSVCDNIEKTVDTALQQAEALRQSILKQAFEGRM